MTLLKYIKQNYKKVIGWGTSSKYEKEKMNVKFELAYFIDNNEKRQGTLLDDKIINSPNILDIETNPEDTLIVIFSSYYEEIIQLIQSKGNYYCIYIDDLLNMFVADQYSSPLVTDFENSVITISRNNFSKYIGGTSKVIREQMANLNLNNYTHIHIFWKEYHLKRYEGVFITTVFNGNRTYFYSLETFLKSIEKIKAIVVHNLIGLELKVFDKIMSSLPEEMPIYYYLHDYFCVADNIEEVFPLGENMHSNQPTYNKKPIYKFHSKLFLNEKIKLIAPSRSIAENMTKIFSLPAGSIKIIAHQTYKPALIDKKVINDKIRIAYVGYKQKYKGWATFKKVVEDFKELYEFYCLGSSDEIIDGVTYVDVSFIQDGQSAMTKKLLEYNIDVSLLWSTVPETYSFTYYESFAAGTYVITSNLSGNIKDQVLINGNGIVCRSYFELKNLLQNEVELKKALRNNVIRIDDLQYNSRGFLDLINKERACCDLGN